jgi:NitT/TauT family transport system permease protein
MNSKLASLLLSIAIGIALLILWQAYVVYFKVPNYLLPRPEAVAIAAVDAFTSGYIWPHLLFTTETTVLGYVLGCAIGVALGSILAEWRPLERALYPYIVFFQSIPKVALAPLLIVWFGYGLESKVVLVALISFFPVFINTFVGIRQTDVDLINVLRVCSASRASVFFLVKLPAAAGAIFASLQIAVSFSLIGAIVAEFVASKQGLGTVIQQGALSMDTGLVLTGVLVLSVMGMIGTAVIRALHKRVVFWEARGDTLTQPARGELTG